MTQKEMAKLETVIEILKRVEHTSNETKSDVKELVKHNTEQDILIQAVTSQAQATQNELKDHKDVKEIHSSTKPMEKNQVLMWSVIAIILAGLVTAAFAVIPMLKGL